jgi:hypothetical protein
MTTPGGTLMFQSTAGPETDCNASRGIMLANN